MRRTRRVRLISLLLCVCWLLGGCASVIGVKENETFGTVQLPRYDEEVPDAPVGDGKDSVIHRATLYYSSEDQTQLMPLTRVLWLTGSWDMAQQLAEELLVAPSAVNTLPVTSSGVSLLSIEVTNGVATVNLSLNARKTQSDAELLLLAMAMANTLTELDRVDCVNMLYGGAQVTVNGLPLGLMRAGDGNVSAKWAIAQAEAERFGKAGDTAYTIEREAALYYPTDDGLYVLPTPRVTRFQNDDYASELIRLLQSSPEGDELLLPGVPYAGDALEKPFSVIKSAEGLRLGELYFVGAFLDAIDRSDVERWQFLASVALTVTSFCPDLDGIRVYIGNRMVEEVPYAAGGGNIRFENGIIRRDDFVDMIGDVATLYFPDADGRLVAGRRVVPMRAAANPRALLAMLMAGPDASALSPVFPEGATAADIIGTRISEDAVLINLSANLYRLCQRFTENEEAAFVYAIVNTLTERNDIRGVRLYADGGRAETLAGHISLMGVLLRNPGIIAP